MPNGLWYAEGPARRYAAKPASAFSKGDILQLDSTSSISRIAVTWASGVDWVGIADADSTQSIDNLVPYLVPEEGTELWCSLSTALTSQVTPGVEGDIVFSTANNRYYFDTSANSVRARVVRGTAGPGAIDQSVQSKVIVRLIRDGGAAEF